MHQHSLWQKYLIQQELEILSQEVFVDILAKTEDVSFDNMKNAVIYGANLASFCVEKFGTERMQTLSADQVKNRLQAFKDLTQFDIKLA